MDGLCASWNLLCDGAVEVVVSGGEEATGLPVLYSGLGIGRRPDSQCVVPGPENLQSITLSLVHPSSFSYTGMYIYIFCNLSVDPRQKDRGVSVILEFYAEVGLGFMVTILYLRWKFSRILKVGEFTLSPLLCSQKS